MSWPSSCATPIARLRSRWLRVVLVLAGEHGDHVARHAGVKSAQALLGVADVQTTQMYTGAPSSTSCPRRIEGYRFRVKEGAFATTSRFR